MATTNTSSTTRAGGAAPRATRSTTARTAAAGGTKPATARRTRTTAKGQTQHAAAANVRAAKATAKETRFFAERAALAGVGLTLEGRDSLMELLDRYNTRPKAEREFKRLERRGATARNQAEREVRKARTRVEREWRTRRREIERLAKRERREIEHDVDTRRNLVTEQVASVTKAVETTAQAGVATGKRVVSKAAGQVATLA